MAVKDGLNRGGGSDHHLQVGWWSSANGNFGVPARVGWWSSGWKTVLTPPPPPAKVSGARFTIPGHFFADFQSDLWSPPLPPVRWQGVETILTLIHIHHIPSLRTRRTHADTSTHCCRWLQNALRKFCSMIALSAERGAPRDPGFCKMCIPSRGVSP